MNIALTIVLVILKVLGVLLLVVLALLLLLLLLPLGVQLAYRGNGERVTVDACVGPAHICVYPRAKKAETEKEEKPEALPPPPAAEEAPPPGQGPVSEEEPPAAAPPTAAGQTPAPPPAETPPEPTSRVERLIAAARAEPMLFLDTALTHLRYAGGRLLRGIHIRHLRVFWTATAPRREAAATAIRYGRMMALLNNLLARAKALMDVQADSLWLEPDYTGELAEKREISCRITLRLMLFVLLAPRLLWRLWHDPLLRPLLQKQRGS